MGRGESKRFSLHARYSFYPSKYAASPQASSRLSLCSLFLFDRRKEGDPNAQSGWSEVQSKEKDVEEGTPRRYVHLPTAVPAADVPNFLLISLKV